MTDPDVIANHRAELRREIILPAAGGAALVLAGLVIILWLRDAVQVSLVADVLLTVLVLLPLLVCSLAVCLGLAAAIWGMKRVHRAAAGALAQAEHIAQQVEAKSQRVTGGVDRKMVTAGGWFGALDRVLRVFDRPAQEDGEGEDEE